MPKRSYSAAGSYRFGFNGKENDNDVKGLGNQQDYGMRIYDARMGRFLSVDPLTGKYAELAPYQFASNRPIQGVDLDGKEVFLVTGSVGGFFTFFGDEFGGGIAFGRDGIALVAFQTPKLGFGLEMGASLNGTLYPTMNNLKDLAGLSLGIGASGAYLGKLGVGINKSSGHWGATGSVGVGVGGHLSFDMSISFIKVVKWEEIVSLLRENTEEAKALQSFFGINGNNMNKAESIVKDYYKTMAEGLRDKRINDLQSDNSKNDEIIKNANEYLNDYNNSGKLYKLFSFFTKKRIEAEKRSAEENTKKNNEELNTLKNTTIFEGGSGGGAGANGKF